MTFTTLRAACLAMLALAATSCSKASGPRAYLLDYADQYTRATGASELLQEAGFDVRELPLDRSPAQLGDGDLIFLASFASEHPRYAEYMKAYAADLARWVEQGRVLVQMTQADQVEARPPFLPKLLSARRADADFATARVLVRQHVLLRGIRSVGGIVQLDETSTVWETLTEQSGFAVLLSADEHGYNPALLEGACGRGRIILSAMAFDKNVPRDRSKTDEYSAPRAAFAQAFFANLVGYVNAVRQNQALPVEATAAPRETPPFAAGSWTFAILPDTQVYCARSPGVFLAQTGWLAANHDRLNIKYVLHLGDITDNNSRQHWDIASGAMGLLDRKVPYALAAGNHDYGAKGDSMTRDTLMHEYFPLSNYRLWPTFGGSMEEDKTDNTYHLFEAGGSKWIIIALEWAPRDETVAWANDVMDRHSDRRGILILHAYMNNNDLRYDWNDKAHPQTYNPHEYKTPGTKNDGEQLWQKLVRRHAFAFVINGHVLGDGTGYLASRTDKGNICHQMLVNYQMRPLGGEGYLRLLEFRPDGRTVVAKSYSPVFDRYLVAPDQQFEMKLE